MTLKADDGTELKAKEGVVVDSEGHPLTGATQTPHARSFSFSLPLPAILGAAIVLPIAFAAGLAFFAVLLLIVTVFFVLSGALRLLRRR